MEADPSASIPSTPSPRTPRLSPVLIYLLRGVLYRDQHPLVWHDLEALESKVIDYFKTIGLELAVDEAEGFAYLKQAELEEEGEIPRLIQRRPLSYPVSVLCVLLRKKVIEAEAGGGGSRVVLTRDQIVEMIRVFSRDRADEAFIEDQIEAHARKAEDLGLLKALKSDPPAYEVRPIIKALVDAEWLQNLDERIRSYQEHGNRVV